MGSMYVLIFLMLCVGVAAWLIFIWAVRSGQYEDAEGPKYRMLDDGDAGPKAGPGRQGPDRAAGEAPPSGGRGGKGPGE